MNAVHNSSFFCVSVFLCFSEGKILIKNLTCFCAGFAVTGHVDGAGKSHVYVSEVDPGGLSAREGPTSESR